VNVGSGQIPRRTIGLKIFGLVLLLSVLAAGVAWVNERKADDIQNLLANINGTYVPIYAALSEAEASSLAEALAVHRLLLDISGAKGSPADFERLAAEADRRAVELEARLARARSLLAAEIADPTSFSDKVLLGRLDTRLEYVQRERASYEQARVLLKQGSIGHDQREMLSAVAVLEEKRDALDQELAAVRVEMLGLLDRAIGMIIDVQQGATRYGVLLLAAALGIGLVVAATVTVNLVRPLRRLVKGAVAVQHGSLDTELPITTRDEVGALTMAFNRMIRELRTKERVRETFGKYVDPRIVEGLVEKPELLASKGERRVMTVCFSDMVGFTALSEGMTPVTLVNLINHYLTAMSDPIRRRSGIIDKYVGDSIMAFWGPPFAPADDQARLACEAGLEQLDKLAEVRQSLPEVLGVKRHLPNIDMRIGIASGDVVVGNVGSPQSMSYTVMGDTVNLASRLEGVNKVYGTHLLVNELTMEMAEDVFEFREIDRILVVGKEEPERVFELLGRRGEVAQAKLDLAAEFAAGLAAYRARDWSGAEAAFRRCLDLVPQDGPAHAFRRRIEQFRHAPPPEGWAAVWQVTDK